MNTKRTISLLICLLLMVTMLIVPSQAAEAITITGVTFEPFQDEFGAEDDTLAVVRVKFTAPEGMAQLSILLAGADITAVTEANKAQVVYQNQIETPEAGEFTFPVKKARIASAAGREEADGTVLYLRLGGSGVAMTSKTVTYTEEKPNYGDLNDDNSVDVADAVLILRYHAGLNTLTTRQLAAADVVQDEKIMINDALRILLFQAGLVDSLVMQP